MSYDTLNKDTVFFIHNVFGNFFKNTLDYFSDTLYDRIGYKTVSTYDKAVEYCNKHNLLGREADKPLLPALILNPTGTMLPADASAGGKQLWRYPNLAAGLGARMFDPIYQDANMKISPIFMRFKGEIELIYLVNSFYEYLDLKVHLINHLGGMDRVIYPNFFTSYMILPEDFVTFTYSNEYTGLRYNLDWASSGATTQLIRSTAQNELVLPLRIKPNFAMTDLSDGSTRYGGTDSVADWRIIANLNYEVEIPTYIVINSNYLVENIKLEVRYGSTNATGELCDVPFNRSITRYHWGWGLDETSNSVLNLQDYTIQDGTSEITITPPPTEITYQEDVVLQNTYLHVVTAAEADSTANWFIEIPAPDYIDGPDYAIISSYACEMNYGDDWLLEDRIGIKISSIQSIEIKYENVIFSEGDLIEINIYNV